MSISAPAAADIPGIFDIIINGQGYMYAREVDPNLPFRTQRAKYGYSPTFIERTNVSGNYGDDQQAFWQTATQNDWSLGEEQHFFRTQNAESIRRYWRGQNIDITTEGKALLNRTTASLTFAAAVVASCVSPTTGRIMAITSTNLYEIDGAGTITDHGAHGAGTPQGPGSLATDGTNVFIAGATLLRKWNGVSFSTFYTVGTYLPVELCFLNNTLYAMSGVGVALGSQLIQFDTSGTPTSIHTFQDASGAAVSNNSPLCSFGGKLLIGRAFGESGNGELWEYDGVGVTKVAEFGPFYVWRLTSAFGIALVSGSFWTGNSPTYESAVWYYANGNSGLLWRSHTTATSVSDALVTGFRSGAVFTDEVNGRLLYWDAPTGSISTIGTFSTGATTKQASLAAGRTGAFVGRNSTTGYFFGQNATTATTGYIATSSFDFESSLTKLFRGIVVEYTAGTDGDGGSVDIAYQVNSLDGAYTTLQTGATSGTEYALTGITGRNISVKVTLNKGTSTYGPTLTRIYVRAVPIQQTFRNDEVILDCTGKDGKTPVQLRNGMNHPNDGAAQVANLRTAITSQSPITIIDRFGSFSGVIEAGEAEIIEIRPDEYYVRLHFREV